MFNKHRFSMKIVALCKCAFFKEFSLQIVSEEVAQQIQQEIYDRRTNNIFELPILPIRPTSSGALLAVKPSTGIKRNNAKASDEGGNTAHKKSDVNSKEWVSLPMSFDIEHGCWAAAYPHLLCTTRQKDPFLDTRCAYQMGKRPLFYFHVRAELFSFSGAPAFSNTISLPFTIATRRNQDCQVQRMLSSYTATCFWLYGTKLIDGLLIRWYDNEISWEHFMLLYSQYFGKNAELARTLSSEDFTIIRTKMYCNECSEEVSAMNQPAQTLTFKNILCPHLHYVNGKTDTRFSIWRAMLELLHLFSDIKTKTKILWEAGVLQGFLTIDRVHLMLTRMAVPSLIAYMSFVIGACICIAIKTSDGRILDLEPIDIKRLQSSKSLYDYLKDIAADENIEYILGAEYEWLSLESALKLCQKSSEIAPPPVIKQLTSNSMYPGPINVEHRLQFTPINVAVVTCKSTASDVKSNKSTHHFNQDLNGENAFERKLHDLMLLYGKTSAEVIDLLSKSETSIYANAQKANTFCINGQNLDNVHSRSLTNGICETLQERTVPQNHLPLYGSTASTSEKHDIPSNCSGVNYYSNAIANSAQDFVLIPVSEMRMEQHYNSVQCPRSAGVMNDTDNFFYQQQNAIRENDKTHSYHSSDPLSSTFYDTNTAVGLNSRNKLP